MAKVTNKGRKQARAAGTARMDGLLPPPVGTSDWARFSRTSYCVDKTLILKDLIDSESTVVLFTRPRRFGKTTTLEMIRAFYEGEASLFRDKKIWAAGAMYRKEQGKHPVIFLSFKDIKQATAEEAFTRLAAVIGGEVARFADCVENGWGDEARKRSLRRVINREGTKDELSESLGLLSEAIHAFTKKPPVILIDEYDQPITTASTNGFYDEMCTFIRVFLSGALKDNKHCHVGIMTGVLRVAKEGILAGLNNPAVWTVFEPEYSQYFGFTEDEVAEMARYYGAEDKLPEIKAWYDGYDFGGTEIYNPWSVLRYFQCNCKPDAYWLDTSSNDLITEIVQEQPFNMERRLHALMKGETITVPMTKELGPYKLIRENENTLYALLVSAGYLKAVGPIDESGDCPVTIPNRELSQVFYREIVQKVRSFDKKGGISAVENALRERDPFLFGKYLAAYLKESVSFFDTAAEGFYHGLVLGFPQPVRREVEPRVGRRALRHLHASARRRHARRGDRAQGGGRGDGRPRRARPRGAASDRHARIHHRDVRRLRHPRRKARHPQVRHGVLQEEPRRLQGSFALIGLCAIRPFTG